MNKQYRTHSYQAGESNSVRAGPHSYSEAHHFNSLPYFLFFNLGPGRLHAAGIISFAYPVTEKVNATGQAAQKLVKN